jgi:hypothetical protein
MPLKKSPTKQAFKSNVGEMVKSGHKLDQALAASYNVKRKAKAPKKVTVKTVKNQFD